MFGRRRNVSPTLMMIILLIIMRFVRGGITDPISWITNHIIMLPAIIVGLSLHEFGHAIVSDKLGDPTPKSQGRVTINPLSHVDPMGLLCLIFAGFGWGVPVQINPSYFKHRRRDEALVAIAGVTMNFIIALISTLILKLILSYAGTQFLASNLGGVISDIFQYMISINVVLLVFNLLPIPPLDGFNLLTQIFNLSKYSWYHELYSKGGMILILLILLGGTRIILSPAVNLLYSFFIGILAL